MADETSDDEVVKAISTLMGALKPLDADSRTHVLEFVMKRLGIAGAGQAEPVQDLRGQPFTREESLREPTPENRAVGLPDIRSFAAEKKPKTVNEKVAVLGYYLAQLAPEGERRDHLISDDIKSYFIQAGFELPTAPPNMTLSNAKHAGYLNQLDRGQYKLNAVGHNLVAHKLPAGESGVEPRRRSSPRKPAKSKAKKKAK
jgi:hypothetical protein